MFRFLKTRRCHAFCFVGSAATADGNLDFPDCGMELAICLYDGPDARCLPHFQAYRNIAVAAGQKVKTGGQGERIFVGNDRNVLRMRNPACHGSRNNRAVFRDVRCGDDVTAVD